MKTIITGVEVPEQLDGMTENQLRILRDKLIIAGVKGGGVDARLQGVVDAFQAAMKSRPPRKARKERAQ